MGRKSVVKYIFSKLVVQMTFFQIKQSISYTEEHLDPDGMYDMQVCKFNERILQIKIQSRHVSSKIHKIWIEYDGAEGTIEGWYCTCKAGARTLGCCAHIALVIWYLGYYRHCERKERRCRNYKNFVIDAEKGNTEEYEEPDVGTNDWIDNHESSSEDDSEDEDL